MFDIIRSATDQSIEFTALDSTTGDPVAIAYNTSGVTATYQRHAGGRPLQSAQSITLASLGSATASHTDGGVIHRADGVHRLDLPDAAVIRGTDGADSVVVLVSKSGVTFVTPRIVLVEPSMTATEIQQLRYRLGLDGTTDTPEASVNLGTINVSVTYGVFAASQGGTSNSVIRVNEDSTWRIPLTGVTVGPDYEKILFMVKAGSGDADTASILTILMSQPVDSGADGLTRLNGAAADSGDRTKAKMELDEDDHPVISVHPTIAGQIAAGSYLWEIKQFDAAGSPYPDVGPLTRGSFNIIGSIIKATS